MAVIKDTGKVWIKGSVGPVHAVRIDDTIFATGKNEDQNIELWINIKVYALIYIIPRKAKERRDLFLLI